jgi:hypothetical protein
LKPLNLILFGAVCIASLTIVGSLAALGSLLAPRFTPEYAEGLGFVIVTSHLVTMIPIQIVAVKLFMRSHVSVFDIGALLGASRQNRWASELIYCTLAAQVGVAALGLGLALAPQRRLAIALTWLLMVGRIVIARACLEPRQYPHLMQYPLEAPELGYPPTRWDRWANRLSDAPLVAVFLAMCVATGHTLWMLGACLVISYSFLVKFGHHGHDLGPVGYVAAVLSLSLSALFIWPVAYGQPARDYGIIEFSFFIALLFYNVQASFDPRIPFGRRAPGIAFSAMLIVLASYRWLYSGSVDMSRSLSFAPFQWTAALWPMIVSLALPLCWYAPITGVADARAWVLRK